MRIALTVLLVGALSGCLGFTQWELCGDEPVVATPHLAGHYMQTAPATAWETVLLLPPRPSVNTTTLGWQTSPGWNATGAPLGNQSNFQRVQVWPAMTAGNVSWNFELQSGDADCRHTQRGSLTWDLATPKQGHSANPGQGVHVMTAGFLDNGTLFYTNIPEIDADPHWPRPDWYAWEGDAPLPVYVYDRDRAEHPAYWKAPSSQTTSQVPPTGTPLDAMVQESGALLDATTGLGYFTTIAGFNAALKGLPTTTTHVVRMTPEQGYTRPGNEAHPLYGQSLTFLIKVLDVVTLPCPAEAPMQFCYRELPVARGAHPAWSQSGFPPGFHAQ